jgi:deoxyribodipyrimidine photolyase-related protein
MRLGVILGDMLFSEHSLDVDTVFMAEDVGLCTHFKYHQHKLVLYLSAMRSHKDSISSDFGVLYHKLSDKSYFERLLVVVQDNDVDTLVTYVISDKFFRDEFISFCDKHTLEYEFVRNPNFLTSLDEWTSWREDKKQLLMQNFYEWQRKRLDILVKNNQPVGGSWSFDKQNREKLPDDIDIPSAAQAPRTSHTEEVISLVKDRFSDHPGSAEDFWLPTTRDDALDWMNDFFSERFKEFGTYQDALTDRHPFVFHSLLSPLINCGLLFPDEVVSCALESEAPLNSKEGFIRQIIGWREFLRYVYETEELENNYFDHSNKLSDSWYDATTGFEPLDYVIKKTHTYGYAHHIERLMVAANLMTLARIDPQDAYKWFMEMFVDSTEWVMMGNVHGMGLFSAGGVFATKPYVSSSNYIKKMSYFSGDWEELWDGLYWSFIADNVDDFTNNYRMRMMASMVDRMDEEKLDTHKNNAKKAMKRLTQ